MKKTAPTRLRKGSGRKNGKERPLEFDRGWHELEAQHDRIKMDWSSLAAQLNIGSDKSDGGYD